MTVLAPRLYVDSADVDRVASLLAAGVVHGVTTNPFFFEGAATSYAVRAFPVVMYAAVRFGSAETPLVLGLVLAKSVAFLDVADRRSAHQVD